MRFNNFGLGLELWCSMPLSTIFQLLQLDWWRELEYPEEKNKFVFKVKRQIKGYSVLKLKKRKTQNKYVKILQFDRKY